VFLSADGPIQTHLKPYPGKAEGNPDREKASFIARLLRIRVAPGSNLGV
jgi:hypothetical protein